MKIHDNGIIEFDGSFALDELRNRRLPGTDSYMLLTDHAVHLIEGLAAAEVWRFLMARDVTCLRLDLRDSAVAIKANEYGWTHSIAGLRSFYAPSF